MWYVPLCCMLPSVQLDSKLESAGLSLWADIEVLPGSVPPDCADFLQQALTKNPRQRPTAQQLLQHAWLARCQAGDPWRDTLELEAARRWACTAAGWTVEGQLACHSVCMIKHSPPIIAVPRCNCH